jgi:hypothetical protein
LTAETAINTPITMEGVSFIPAEAKKELPAYERLPRYYFVLDASANSPYDEHRQKVPDYMQKHTITEATIYAASYQVCDTAAGGVERKGGFNLPLAMDVIFRDVGVKNAQGSGLPCYPVIIAVSDNIYQAPAFLHNAQAKEFPESPYYYNLGYDLSLTPYSFQENEKQDSVTAPLLSKAVTYNGLVVAADNKSETVISGPLGEYTDNEYHNAFMLWGKTSFHDNSDETQIAWVRDSFRQKLLTPYTAFTVLETQEQEKALLELQDKFLNGSGEAEAPAVSMDEPGLPAAGLIMALLLLVYRYRMTRRRLHRS